MRRYSMALGLVFAAVVAGCSSDGRGPVFDNEGAVQPACLVHQSGEPGTRYTERDQRNSAEVFALLKYYTFNGAKQYCDNEPPNESDKAWAQVYLDLGGKMEKVPSILP